MLLTVTDSFTMVTASASYKGKASRHFTSCYIYVKYIQYLVEIKIVSFRFVLLIIKL